MNIKYNLFLSVAARLRFISHGLIHNRWDCVHWSFTVLRDRWTEWSVSVAGTELGDNCIQNVHLGRYIVCYMVGNFVLRRRVSGAVKRNFWPYNRWYTSTNEHFEYGYPHCNALVIIYSSKAQHFAQNWSFVSNVKQLRQPITSDVTYNVGAPTLYRRIYWRKFLTLSSQTSRYIRKCIRMLVIS